MAESKKTIPALSIIMPVHNEDQQLARYSVCDQEI